MTSQTNEQALEEAIEKCDIVITGEGKIDSQTKNGKVPMGVAQIAKKYEVPVIVVAGSISDDANIIHEYGIDAMFSIINYPMSIAEAIEQNKAKLLIKKSAEQIFRLIRELKSLS